MLTSERFSPSEQSIVNDICQYLTIMHVPFARIRNTGAIISRNNKTFFGRPRSNQRGVSDIIACVFGVALAVEVKARKGVVSDEQIQWLEQWKVGGGQYIVARSLDDVIQSIESIRRDLDQLKKTA